MLKRKRDEFVEAEENYEPQNKKRKLYNSQNIEIKAYLQKAKICKITPVQAYENYLQSTEQHSSSVIKFTNEEIMVFFKQLGIKVSFDKSKEIIHARSQTTIKRIFNVEKTVGSTDFEWHIILKHEMNPELKKDGGYNSIPLTTNHEYVKNLVNRNSFFNCLKDQLLTGQELIEDKDIKKSYHEYKVGENQNKQALYSKVYAVVLQGNEKIDKKLAPSEIVETIQTRKEETEKKVPTTKSNPKEKTAKKTNNQVQQTPSSEAPTAFLRRF